MHSGASCKMRRNKKLGKLRYLLLTTLEKVICQGWVLEMGGDENIEAVCCLQADREDMEGFKGRHGV